MTRSLSRCLAVAILVLVPLGILLPIISTLLTWREDVSQRMDTASRTLAKYGDQAGRVAALKDILDKLEASDDGKINLIAGATDDLASASLQTRVKQLVDAGGGTVQSLQILPPQPEATLSRIAVRVQFSAQSADFQKIIYGIETGVPRLTIGALEVRQGHPSDAASDGDDQQDGELVVQLVVSGFRRMGQAS